MINNFLAGTYISALIGSEDNKVIEYEFIKGDDNLFGSTTLEDFRSAVSSLLRYEYECEKTTYVRGYITLDVHNVPCVTLHGKNNLDDYALAINRAIIDDPIVRLIPSVKNLPLFTKKFNLISNAIIQAATVERNSFPQTVQSITGGARFMEHMFDYATFDVKIESTIYLVPRAKRYLELHRMKFFK